MSLVQVIRMNLFSEIVFIRAMTRAAFNLPPSLSGRKIPFITTQPQQTYIYICVCTVTQMTTPPSIHNNLAPVW